jgi:hypothetical protein
MLCHQGVNVHWCCLFCNISRLLALVPSAHKHRSGIPGAGNCGNLSKDALPPAVQYELQGQLQGHAEGLAPAEDAAQQPKDVEASAGDPAAVHIVAAHQVSLRFSLQQGQT